MCRSIKTLHNFEPPALDEEIEASARQFVRKLSGFALLVVAGGEHHRQHWLGSTRGRLGRTLWITIRGYGRPWGGRRRPGAE